MLWVEPTLRRIRCRVRRRFVDACRTRNGRRWQPQLVTFCKAARRADSVVQLDWLPPCSVPDEECEPRNHQSSVLEQTLRLLLFIYLIFSKAKYEGSNKSSQKDPTAFGQASNRCVAAVFPLMFFSSYAQKSAKQIELFGNSKWSCHRSKALRCNHRVPYFAAAQSGKGSNFIVL
ncbi:hypothetical protein MUK42_28698 [Musa troglodytarum]|uniref:Uncharacterized protein n=1 Tax=Musa troglodytarum TaxID=320322 RepID=A0A9E7K856_9LILI|nr:hypothetical protein MUK42_28698 [Musa troglodytarum]